MATQLTIFDFLEEPKEVKPYNYTQMVEKLNQKLQAIPQLCSIPFRMNIALYFATPSKALSDLTYDDKDIDRYFENYSKVYDSFCYHLFNKELVVMSYKLTNAYHVLLIPRDDEFVVELPPITNLQERLCAPACAIDWFNKDGTPANMGNYLKIKDNEVLTNEIMQPKETATMSYSEYYKDRREYYFFNIIKIHKYGRAGRVFDKHTYDTFTDYTWTLWDMARYFGNDDVEE